MISGPGGVELGPVGIGGGETILTGDNTYLGGTRIQDTTILQLGNGGPTGSIIGNVTFAPLGINGPLPGSLIFDRSNTYVFDGVISGPGNVTQAGPGTTILNAINTYSQGTTVDAGTLLVGDVNHPGASIAGDATVNAAGTLAGHGTIFGNVANLGGVVMPGGTIGVLSVGGNYTQSAAGTLSIEVSPIAASQLHVGGAANLAGKLALIFDPGVYSAASYKILIASSVHGTFATVIGLNPSGAPQAVVYNPGDVTL